MEKKEVETKELDWIVSQNPRGKEDLIKKLEACQVLGKKYMCIHTDTFDWTEYITFDCPTHLGQHNNIGNMQKCMDSYLISNLLAKLKEDSKNGRKNIFSKKV